MTFNELSESYTSFYVQKQFMIMSIFSDPQYYMFIIKDMTQRDFPDGPVVKNLTFNESPNPAK